MSAAGYRSSLRFSKPIISPYRASVPFLIIHLIAPMIITFVSDLSLILLRGLRLPTN